MILFDLIVVGHTADPLKDAALYSKCIPGFFTSFSPVLKSLSTAYIVKTPEVLTQNKRELSKKSFIRQNLWQKIANTVWTQSVFLSFSNRVSDKYFVELNYLNIHDDQNIGKNLIAKFSQSLLEGSIESSLSKHVSTSLPVLPSIQYPWHKGFGLKQKKILNFFQRDVYQDYLEQVKNYLSRDSALDHFPLFTVSNHLGQMVISEPPSRLGKKKDVLDCVLPDISSKRLHQGWFFTNFEDAQEYMQSISNYYGLQAGHLKIFTCNFSALYKIADKFSQVVYFRLVPDLQEVGKLIKNYRSYSNISFYKKQNYSATYFQGQPLYIPKDESPYIYLDPNSGQEIGRYNPLFTNYETACSVMSKIANQYQPLRYKQSKMPELAVYNLESFMEEHLLKKDPTRSYLVVPSQNSYWFTKEYFMKKRTNLATDAIASRISSIRLWSKRVLWSLTSKQPQDW